MDNQNDKDNYVKSSKGSETNSKEKIFGQLTNGKLLFLGVISLLLSVLGPLCIFAPVPMAVAFLLYGKSRSWIMSLSLSAIVLIVSLVFKDLAGLLSVSISYFIATLVAFLTARVVWNKTNPVTGLIKNGLFVFTLIALLFGAAQIVSEKPVLDLVTEQVKHFGDVLKQSPDYDKLIATGGEQAESWKYIVEQPKEIASKFLKMAFAGVFVGVFFVFWMSQFMLMRNTLIWRELHDYPYTMKDFVRFKIPEQFVFVLLGAMAMIPLGTHVLENEMLQVVGWNIVYSLGVFYFFQGFGIVSEALDAFGIFGFFRSVLIILTIFMGYQFVSLLGVVDIWVNFRKFLKKKNNNEGDII
ncbi:hypothetical protein A9Q84_08540 [Halobacteriovorax marinus]|uniref:DUF2232 domain-containing protein n=1 Tax=Halobacteriovorax marinus TaxID=97084 RepID=A0A1Y5FBN7_9BACT|nr:hypothetical protein A9Q84_08540 [Halobacteriovorax marinus]